MGDLLQLVLILKDLLTQSRKDPKGKKWRRKDFDADTPEILRAFSLSSP
jgi:hypothetical protein